MSLEYRAVRDNDEEKAQCLDLWCAVFGDTNREYFARYFYGDTEWLPYYTQVAVLDERIVSSVSTVKRTVACGDFKLTMGGVANVSTYLEHRGKGYNLECLKRIIGIMEADAFDFTTLGTGIPPYYEKVGYELQKSTHLSGTIADGFSLRESPYAVRIATPEDRPRIQEIYEQYNEKRPIAVQRDESYWRGWVCDSAEPPLLAIDSNGVIVGYAATAIGLFHGSSMEDEHGGVSEFGTALTEPAEKIQVAKALLDTLMQETIKEGKREFNVDIALDSEVLSALKETLVDRKSRPETGDMIRLLHRSHLLKSFTLDLNERWHHAEKPSGTLDFSTPYGGVRLNATGSLLKVEETDATIDPISQANLFGLLFGAVSPESVTTDPEKHLLLEALFPRQAAVYYSADGF